MLDQSRMDEIKRRVDDAYLEYLSNKDTIREYYSVVNEAYEEVSAWVLNNKHSNETARLFIELEQRRVELAALLGEEIEQEA